MVFNLIIQNFIFLINLENHFFNKNPQSLWSPKSLFNENVQNKCFNKYSLENGL